jgi:hypothetical protein
VGCATFLFYCFSGGFRLAICDGKAVAIFSSEVLFLDCKRHFVSGFPKVFFLSDCGERLFFPVYCLFACGEEVLVGFNLTIVILKYLF